MTQTTALPDGLVQRNPTQFGARYFVHIATWKRGPDLSIQRISDHQITQPDLLQNWIRETAWPQTKFVLFWEVEIVSMHVTFLASHICTSPGSLVGDVTIMKRNQPVTLYGIAKPDMLVRKLPGCEALPARAYLELDYRTTVAIPSRYHLVSLLE